MRGQDMTAQYRTAEDRTGQEKTAQDMKVQDMTGQDVTGQERTGHDRTFPVRIEQDSTGQDTSWIVVRLRSWLLYNWKGRVSHRTTSHCDSSCNQAHHSSARSRRIIGCVSVLYSSPSFLFPMTAPMRRPAGQPFAQLARAGRMVYDTGVASRDGRSGHERCVGATHPG